MTTTKLTVALFAALSVATLANTVNAAPGSHLDEVALRLQRQAAELNREFRLHFRHTPEFGHLVSDANQIQAKAAHIHRVAHHSGSVWHLRHEVEELDRLFHHMEDVVDRIDRHAAHGIGHIHGHLAHVYDLLDDMEDTLHHLRRDLARITSGRPAHGGWHSNRHGGYVVPHSGYHSGYVVPRSGHGRGVSVSRHGIAISNGRIGFRFGF